MRRLAVVPTETNDFCPQNRKRMVATKNFVPCADLQTARSPVKPPFCGDRRGYSQSQRTLELCESRKVVMQRILRFRIFVTTGNIRVSDLHRDGIVSDRSRPPLPQRRRT